MRKLVCNWRRDICPCASGGTGCNSWCWAELAEGMRYEKVEYRQIQKKTTGIQGPSVCLFIIMHAMLRFDAPMTATG